MNFFSNCKVKTHDHNNYNEINADELFLGQANRCCLETKPLVLG